MTGVQPSSPADVEIASKADQERVFVAQFVWQLRISDKKSFRPRQFRALGLHPVVMFARDRSLRRQPSAEHARPRQRPAVALHDCDFRQIF
jgi:hypothetical protein